MADIYDKLTRHQVYIEGVKAWQGANYSDTLDTLSRAMNRLTITQPRDRSLLDMTPSEYRAFERRVTTQLDRTLKRSYEVMLKDFEDFSKADNRLLNAILRSERGTRRRAPTHATIWRNARTRVMGANGLTIEETMRQYFTTVKADVLSTVRQARVNGGTFGELRDRIFGTKAKAFSNGLMTKAKNNARTVIATSIQHITSNAQTYLEAMFYERYRWVSVLDEKTTEVCKSRDGKVYRYGKGPIPPAHYNCRSKIVPIEENRRNVPSSWFEWLREQPSSVLSDIVGSKDAARIRSGEATAQDFPAFMSQRKVPLDKLEDKLSFILAD